MRVWPHPAARERAINSVPDAPDAWHAYLRAYSELPAGALLRSEPVQLTTSLQAIMGEAGVKVACTRCGEEIMNRREVHVGGRRLCATCAGSAYYVGAGVARGPRVRLGA
jgi:formylmethanofuran dehydrogenase subunit E